MIPENIKKLIENRFGRKILYSKDCEALAISIRKTSNESISATTLKRIFGFAKNIEKPRLFTLNTIAKYVDFADWGSLLHSNSNIQNIENRLPQSEADHSHAIQQQLIIMMMTGIIDIKKVESLCVKYGARDEIINLIIDLVIFAGKSKNVLFLKQVFDLPVVFDSIIKNPKLLDLRLYFIGQSVGMALRTDKTMAAELIKIYGVNSVAQVILVEWFVDEDYIDGYYGPLLEVYFKNKTLTNETKIFYYALKNTRAQQIKDQAKQKYWANKLRKIELSSDYHPILIGRYLGICLSEDVDNALEKEIDPSTFILKCFQNYNYIQKTYLGLFSLRYLIANKNKTWFIRMSELIEEELKKEKLVEKDFWAIKIDNQLLIYFAYAKYLTGNARVAKSYLNKIDPHLFDVFRYHSLHNDFSVVQSLLVK